MKNLMPGNCTRVWSTCNTHKYRAQLAGLRALSSMMLPMEYMMDSLVNLPSAPAISCFPNQCLFYSAPSTLADPRARKVNFSENNEFNISSSDHTWLSVHPSLSDKT